MDQVTHELLQACRALRGNPHMDVFMAWVRESGARSVQMLVDAEEPSQCARLQGETRALAKIVDTMDNAEQHSKNFDQ